MGQPSEWGVNVVQMVTMEFNNMMNFFKKIFGESRKYSVSNSEIIRMGGPDWNLWNTDKATKEGFKANGYVYRSIQMISQIGSSVDFVVYDSNNNVLLEHPITILLKNPSLSPFFPKSIFFDTLISWLYLSGFAPINKIVDGQGRTKELSLISPDRIIYARSNGVPIGYKVDVEGNHNFIEDRRINLKTIIPLRFPDPSDPYSGISPLMVAGQLVDIMTETRSLSKATAANSGVMDGILTFDAGIPEHQMDVVRNKIRETFRQNRKSGYPNVLGGNPNYIRMALNQVEMDLIEQNKANREEILMIFGISPQLLGLEGTIKYDNFSSSLRVFGATTITPLLVKITSMLTTGFNDELNAGERIGYFAENIPALSQDDEQKSIIASRYYNTGVPISQLNEKLTLGLKPFDGWDLPFNGLSNISSVPINIRKDDFPLETRRKVINVPSEEYLFDGIYSILKMQYTDIAKELWTIPFYSSSPNEIVNVIKRYDNEFYSIIKSLLLGIIDKGLKKDIAIYCGPKFEWKAVEINDSMFELSEASSINTINDLVLLFQNHTINELMKAWNDKDIWEENGVKYLITLIGKYGIFGLDSATRISSIIYRRIENIAQFEKAKFLGATTKRWESMRDDKVRTLHQQRNGMVAPINELILGALYPCEPGLLPGDFEWCRCLLSYCLKK